jgi:hypothetical protein
MSPDVAVDLESEKKAARALMQSGVEFRGHRMTDGHIEGGGRAYFNIDQSSDGVWIESSGEEWNSESKAKDAFANRLKNYRILRHETELDSEGHRAGEMAIGVKPLHDQSYQAIVAFRGPKYCADSKARSLRHLLAFLRKY